MGRDSFQALIKIIDRLLSKEGCRWDRSQDLFSLRGFVLEEALELIDALSRRDLDAIEEELGDILYHVVFISRLTGRKDSLTRAIKGICNKLITRHPHIFGSRRNLRADEVVKEWEKIKLKEKKAESIGYGISPFFPSLLIAYKLGVRSVSYNFDWEDLGQVFEKLNEEIGELKEELKRRRKNRKAIESEIGDILFVVANIARHLNVNPEIALMNTNKRFIKRFDRMCELIKKDKKDIHRLDIIQLEDYWQRAKKMVR